MVFLSMLSELLDTFEYLIVRDIVLFMAAAVVLVNFVVDMAYAALDPRIRLQ